METVAVHFTNGAELLRAHWGYLENGGLLLEERGDWVAGDLLKLAVQVGDAGAASIAARVVRADDELCAVEFLPGQPHDLLLSYALADADKTVLRTHTRYPDTRPIAVEAHGERWGARLTDVSRGGCRFELASDAPLSPGDSIEVHVAGTAVSGEIAWSSRRARGVRFTAPPNVVAKALKRRSATVA